jgi:hypothetical protein
VRISSSTTSDSASSTTETAAADVTASLSMRPKMNTDATSVLNGMLPATSTTEPNSPTARAKASAAPEMIAGTRFGSTIRRNTVSDPAPSDTAASSISRSSSISTGCTARTTNGSVTNSNAIAIAQRVPTTLIPDGLFGP